MPKKKLAKGTTRATTGSVTVSVASEAANTQSAHRPEAHGSDDDGEIDHESMNEKIDYDNIVQKVRRECDRMRTAHIAGLPKSCKDEILGRVTDVVKETFLLLISKKNPEDVSKFQDLQNVKRFEFVCKSEVALDGCIFVVVRKKGRLVVSATSHHLLISLAFAGRVLILLQFGKFHFAGKGLYASGMQWSPFVEFRIDAKGKWHLKRAIKTAFQPIDSPGIWNCLNGREQPDKCFTLRKHEAVRVVICALKDILEKKPWEMYDITSASSKSDSSWKDDMWDGERYTMPSL